MLVLVEIAVALCIVSLLCAVVGWIVHRPRIDHTPVRHVLIFAAHSDDCVVVAGEYAIDAAASGRSIALLYLTCSDTEVGSQRAITRRREAIACWNSLGVTEEHITFVELPSSSLGGTAVEHDATSLARARESIAAALRSAPAETAVFVPADGESHSDHLLLRSLVLNAMNEVKRDDLHLYESPEYNKYVSTWQTPLRGVVVIGSSMPLVSRIFKMLRLPAHAGFIRGGAGLRRPPNAQRFARKLALFDAFVSENPALLVEHFGRPDLYRPVAPIPNGTPFNTYVKVGKWRFGASTLLLVVSIALCELVLSLAVGRTLLAQGLGTPLAWMAGLLAVAFVAYTWWRSTETVRRLHQAAYVLGLCMGAWGLFRA